MAKAKTYYVTDLLDVCDAETGDYLMSGNETDRRASVLAAKRDGGSGVVTAAELSVSTRRALQEDGAS